MSDKNPDVQAIVADWLEKHGYDGLYNDDCGCFLDDLYPCVDGPCADCRAGYTCIIDGQVGVAPRKDK